MDVVHILSLQRKSGDRWVAMGVENYSNRQLCAVPCFQQLLTAGAAAKPPLASIIKGPLI